MHGRSAVRRNKKLGVGGGGFGSAPPPKTPHPSRTQEDNAPPGNHDQWRPWENQCCKLENAKVPPSTDSIGSSSLSGDPLITPTRTDRTTSDSERSWYDKLICGESDPRDVRIMRPLTSSETRTTSSAQSTTGERQKVSQGCQTDALSESNWPNRNLMDYAPTEDPDELLARQLTQELQTNAETSTHSQATDSEESARETANKDSHLSDSSNGTPSATRDYTHRYLKKITAANEAWQEVQIPYKGSDCFPRGLANPSGSGIRTSQNRRLTCPLEEICTTSESTEGGGVRL